MFVSNIRERMFTVPQQRPVTKVKFLSSVSPSDYINAIANNKYQELSMCELQNNFS
jgi:hypothetical protein